MAAMGAGMQDDGSSNDGRPTRVGLIGFGFIGSNVYRRIEGTPSLGLEVAFVYNRDPGRLADVPHDLRLDALDGFASRSPDLIVEMAHPAITRDHGADFLRVADYVPLSVTALADDAVHDALVRTAERHGTCLLIPHGALVGADNLYEARDAWTAVTITFHKHPRSIDFSESGTDGTDIRRRTTVYDGPARGIAARFPRNVNTMVTCALATVGLDRCRAVLIADPELDNMAIAEVEAVGRDGSRLSSRKEQPMTGVSGTEMLDSQFHSILRAADRRAALEFV